MLHPAIKLRPDDQEYKTLSRCGNPIIIPATVFDSALRLGFNPDPKLKTFAELISATARGVQEASFIPRMMTVGLLFTERDRLLFKVEESMQKSACSG